MNACIVEGCSNLVPPGIDRCFPCRQRNFSKQGGASGASYESNKDASSGGDNDYWKAKITHPKRLEPYEAECEDLIEHFQFSFAEGNAFKALWRMGMDRVAQGKPGDTPLRNAQKVAYYGARMEVAEQRKLEEA